jgi:EmrB/QacA subfamily drug resistance transporter
VTLLAAPPGGPAASERAARAGHRRAGLAVLSVAILVVNLDNTILNVALPTLSMQLHATSSQLQWIVDVYALVFAGMLLACGSAADRYGRKRMFLGGLGVFALGSSGAAFAGSVTGLVGWRALMGLGAAMTMPSTLSLINDLFHEPGERARAIGVWAGTSGLGIAIGPIAGGVLLSHYWWGSVFFVNVPIIAVGLVAGAVLLPDTRSLDAHRPDPAGAVLSIVALGLVLWSIIEAPTHGWTSPSVVVAGATGLALLVAFVWWELRSSHPMLNLGFYRSRRFSAASGSITLGVFALFGALFVQTQFLQFDLGYTPLQAGVRILPVALVVAVAAPLSTVFVSRVGSKVVATAGLAAVGSGLLQMAFTATASTTYTDMLPGLLLLGFGSGLMMPTATDAVLGSVPRDDAAVGSATNGVSIQVGGALGVAVIGSLLSTRYQDRLVPAITSRHLPAGLEDTVLGSIGGAMRVADGVGGAAGRSLQAAAHAAFMSGIGLSLAVGGAVAAAGALVALVALPARPARPAAPQRGPISVAPTGHAAHRAPRRRRHPRPGRSRRAASHRR